MNPRPVLPALLFLFLPAAAILCPAQELSRDPFYPFTAPPIADSPFPVTIEKVRKYWIASMWIPRPPSRLENDYGHEMNDYRRRLKVYNCLVERIHDGEFDCEAEIVMLRHNIRLADRLRQTAEAQRLRDRLQRLLHPGHASSDFDSGRANLEKLVVEQARQIAELRAEIEALKASRP
ncbi:MAG: hypothetical protein HKN23_12625 [Verrucomicrobiales bacterium]|nr:hypothetical protein [Verrucomicrobiales bacterium]